MTDRPLHPFSDHRVFQHPIQGTILKGTERIGCYVYDMRLPAHEDDTHIYVGVEIHRSRCELGAWLTKCHPDDEHKILNHVLVDAIFPINFDDEESAETQASLLRIDMAQDVINAGGACTICEAPYEDGVDHVVGCEVMSWLMYVMARAITADEEPTLSQVVRAAHQQIERMQ